MNTCSLSLENFTSKHTPNVAVNQIYELKTFIQSNDR